MNNARLYTFPFACSLAVDVVLRQHRVPTERVHVARGPARRVQGDFIHPKRKVPVLELDGIYYTEIIAILSYLDRRLEPERSEDQAQRHLEWLAFVASELHQPVLAPYFDPDAPKAAKTDAVERILPPVLAVAESELSGPTVLGGEPTGADAYLFWALLLTQNISPALLGPRLADFQTSMLAHGFVRAAVKAAGEAATRQSGGR